MAKKAAKKTKTPKPKTKAPKMPMTPKKAGKFTPF